VIHIQFYIWQVKLLEHEVILSREALRTSAGSIAQHQSMVNDLRAQLALLSANKTDPVSVTVLR
jgi:hypothetical protein